MAVLISLDGVTRRHADQQVLDGVTLGVEDGDRVGVIGANGSGKSTLLRILAGVDEPDDGRVVTGSRVQATYVAQEPAFDPDQRVLDAVTDAAPAQPRTGAVVRDAMDSAEAAERERSAVAYLDRLGVRSWDQTLGALSGGQRKRVALARGIAADDAWTASGAGEGLLVLDEPTTHLDVDVVEWLEGHLRARTGGLVIVTHDRYLLDRVATRIVEVEGGTTRSGYGNYAAYLEARSVRAEQTAAEERRRQNRARVELAWLRRGAKARTSKAKYRVERAWDLVETGPPEEAAELQVALPSRRIGSKVVNLHNAGTRYGDRWVLRGVEHRLAPDARIGIVGPNGAGKTTLLSLIAGRKEPDAGKVSIGETIVPGWYGQDPEALPAQQRVIDAVKEIVLETRVPDGKVVTAAQLLERFGFPASLQRSWVGQLSGGERRRLELLRVLATMPNLLLLDEPTNDLDLDTLAVLEEFLDTWPGALVVASHDRYFLDRVCDDLFSVEPDGTVRHHPGGWTAWREVRAEQARAARAVDRVPVAPGPAAAPGERPRKLGFRERRELDGLDVRMATLETRKVELAGRMQDAGGDHSAVLRAGEELTAVIAELEEAESRWLELAETAEAAQR